MNKQEPIMKKYLTGALTLIAASAFTANADIPLEYYSSMQGLKGAQLKTAVHNIISDNTNMLSYGSGDRHTWWGFYATDRNEANNEVIDRYSNDRRYYGSRGSSVDGMNIEHSFPKSWWGGSTGPDSYRDLYNLMPCEQKINSSKSNYPMGKVTQTNPTTNGCTKIGTGPQGYKLWEPADKWKGDFARGYMYMATAYQNLTWSGAQALQCLQQGAYPTLQPWAYELYLEWARQDDVNEMEITRNDRVSGIQGNRNPFVDFPNLMEYIWGDSTDIAIDIRTTKKAGKSSGTIIDPSEKPAEVYACTFIGDDGGCTAEYALRPSNGMEVWKLDAQYGWKAAASTGSTKYDNLKMYDSDATLLTPEIDLSAYAVASFTFEHACNWCADPSAALSVNARTDDGTETTLTVPTWPKGNSWAFVESGKVDLNKFASKKIRLAFRYTSTTAEAATWEIKNLSVMAQGRYSGIENIPAYLQPEVDNSVCPVEFYTTDGRRVDPATYRGIVIRRQGTSVTKLLLR